MVLNLKKLGENIRQRRTSRGWSLGDFAEKTTLSKAYLSDLENGVGGKPNVQYLLQVATVLETTIDSLVKGAESEASAQSVEIADHDLLPTGLREFARESSLEPSEVQMLAQLHFRGDRPRDKEGWRAVYQVLRAVSS